jgi:hypothetical protein
MKKKIDKLIDKSLRFHHRDIHQKIDGMKLHAQVKSKWYYIFWGIATVSVVVGQIYVGSGFRTMSNSVNQVLEKLNEIPSSSS